MKIKYIINIFFNKICSHFYSGHGIEEKSRLAQGLLILLINRNLQIFFPIDIKMSSILNFEAYE